MQCGLRVGFFLKRFCDEPADAVCERCKRDVCPAHIAPAQLSTTTDGQVLCVECLPSTSSRSSQEDYDDSYDDSTSYSSTGSSYSRGSSNEFEAGGGEFGGGGSSSGWIPAARLGKGETGGAGKSPASDTPADALTRQGFTAEDIAAFDQVAAAGKDRNEDLYDS